MRALLLISLLVTVSCTTETSTTDPDQDLTTKADSTGISSEEQIQEIENLAIVRLEKQKNSLDSILHVIEIWNTAINDQDRKTLESLYAERVSYYKKSLSRTELLNSKFKALEAQPDYHQSYSNVEVQYPTDESKIVRCVFDKEYKTSDGKKTTSAIIELRFKDDEYHITKESDQPSEFALVQAMKTAELPKGKSTYTYDYWVDMRNNDVLAHEYVPYYMVVRLNHTDSLEIEFYWYSGSMRQVTDFNIRNARVNGGYLTFEGAPLDSFGDPDEPISEKDYQSFKFKIILDKLALIENKDGWFSSMKGVVLWQGE